MNNLEINTMTKKALSEKLAADAAAWVQANGKPDLYAADMSPRERFALFGNRRKRTPVKVVDPQQAQYDEWLLSQQPKPYWGPVARS